MFGVKQAVIAGLGASAVAGGGYGTYYLLSDKTIKDTLISKGVTLINGTDEYQVAFIENKGDQELVKLLSNVTATSKSDVGGVALKVWCEKSLALDLSEKNIKETLPNVEKYCSKPSSTIEERLAKLNKKQLLKKKLWKDKAKEIKGSKEFAEEFKNDLGTKHFEGDDEHHTKVGEALKTWCGENIKKPLIQDKAETVWKKVEARCLEAKG